MLLDFLVNMALMTFGAGAGFLTASLMLAAKLGDDWDDRFK